MRINTVQVPQACPSIHSVRLHRPAPYREQHAWRHVDFVDERGITHRFFLEQVAPAEAVLGGVFALLPGVLRARLHLVAPRSVTPPPPHARLLRQHRAHRAAVRCPPHGTSLEGVFASALKEAFDAKQLDFALRLFVLNHSQSGVPAECEAWAKQATKEQVLEEVCDDSVLTQFMCR